MFQMLEKSHVYNVASLHNYSTVFNNMPLIKRVWRVLEDSGRVWPVLPLSVSPYHLGYTGTPWDNGTGVSTNKSQFQLKNHFL